MIDKTIVLVRRRRGKKKRPGAKRPQPKAPLRSPRRKSDLGRRRIRAAGGIKFFDLGQLKVGDAWELNDFFYSLNPITAVETGNQNHYTFFIDDQLSLVTCQEFEETILSQGVANFEIKFRPVVKSVGKAFAFCIDGIDQNDEPFLYEIGGTYDNWNDSGLELTPAQLAYKQINFIPQWDIEERSTYDYSFVFFSLGDDLEGIFKVTAGSTFESPAVAYSLQNGDKVFFMPALGGIDGHQFDHSNPDPENNIIVLWNAVHTLKPRKFDDPEAIFTDPVSSLGEGSNDPGTFSEAKNQWVSHRALVTQEFTVFGPPAVVPGSFPIVSPPVDEGVTTAPTVLYGAEPGISGRLCAVIKRGSAAFYVWSV